MTALLLATQLAAGPTVDAPIFEGWAGRYATFTAAPNEDPRAGGALDTTRGSHWQGQATLRTPAWRGLRVFAQAETAPQSGVVAARSFETWQGAEVVGGLSWDGFAYGAWTVSPAIAAGGVVALGDDRDRVDVTPSLLAAGARFGFRTHRGAQVRLYAGLGRHEVTNGDDLVGILDLFVKLPLLGDRVALHAKVISGEASSWRYGIVARWW